MEKKPVKDLYNGFARFYNKYWTKATPKFMLKALDILLFPKVKKGSSILDICCGTGHMANKLNRLGFKVEGLDSSATMLAYAYINAPDVKFYHNDATDFKLNKKYNAVISLFDSVNHFLTEEALLSLFKNVHAHLKNNGIFVFDINSKTSSVNVENNNFSIAEDSSAFMLNAFYNESKKELNYNITMFEKEGNYWARYDETIIEKFYETELIISYLKKAGFNNIAVAKGFDDLKIITFRDRIFISAWK